MIDQPKMFKQQVKSVPAIRYCLMKCNITKKSMARWFSNDIKFRPKRDTYNDK